MAGWLLLLICALHTGPTFAQRRPDKPPPPAKAQVADKVAVKLLVVAATDAHDHVDPRLEPLTRYLRFLRYRGYDLVNSHVTRLSPKEHATFSISGGRRVVVTLLEKTPERAQFRVELHSQGGKLLDTTLSVNRNGTFIVAGPKYGDGILILPLQARY